MDKLLPIPRPKELFGSTTRYHTACGWVYVTINKDEDGYPLEVFSSMGKCGGCALAMLESVSRTLSVALRCGVDAGELASQYIGIQCPNGSWEEGTRVTSCSSAIGMALKRVLDRVGGDSAPETKGVADIAVDVVGAIDGAGGSAEEELAKSNITTMQERYRVLWDKE